MIAVLAVVETSFWCANETRWRCWRLVKNVRFRLFGEVDYAVVIGRRIDLDRARFPSQHALHANSRLDR